MSDIVRVLPYTICIENPINKKDLQEIFVMGDGLAHRFEISIRRGSSNLNIDNCTVKGFFTNILKNTTVEIDGCVEDGKAVVTLSEPCYSLHGQFVLTIQICNGGAHTTVFFGEGYMRESKAENIIFDNYVIYDVPELLNHIDEMRTQTEAAREAMDVAASLSEEMSLAERARDEAETARAEAEARREEIVGGYADELSSLKADLDDLRTKESIEPVNILNHSKSTSGYMKLDGSVSSSSSLVYSEKIEVVEGDVLRFFVQYGTGLRVNAARFITAFNGNTAVSSKGKENSGTYEVPNGITSVVISYPPTYKWEFTKNTQKPDNYTEWFEHYKTCEIKQNVLPKASETVFGDAKMWVTIDADGNKVLNISTGDDDE